MDSETTTPQQPPARPIRLCYRHTCMDNAILYVALDCPQHRTGLPVTRLACCLRHAYDPREIARRSADATGADDWVVTADEATISPAALEWLAGQAAYAARLRERLSPTGGDGSGVNGAGSYRQSFGRGVKTDAGRGRVSG